jgi:hypothetical protein
MLEVISYEEGPGPSGANAVDEYSAENGNSLGIFRTK